MSSSDASYDPEQLLGEAAWLRRLAHGLCSDSALADDLSQETLLAAWQARGRLTGPLRPWLRAVLRRLHANRARANARRHRYESAAAVPGPATAPATATDELVARAGLHRDLVDAVMELDEPYRTTILLRYFEDLPPRSIAARLAVPVETVRTRIKRGIGLLRSRLDRMHGDRATWVGTLTALTEASAIPTTTTTVTTTGLGAGAFALSLLIVAGFAVFHWYTNAPEELEQLPAAGSTTSPAASSKAAEPSRQRIAVDDPGADGRDQVLVTDTASGGPVAEATVSLLPPAGAPRVLRLVPWRFTRATDPEGIVRVPGSGAVNLTVTAPGYLPHRSTVTLGSGRQHRIGLRKSSALTLVFQGSGVGIPGVVAVLLPPLEKGTWIGATRGFLRPTLYGSGPRAGDGGRVVSPVYTGDESPRIQWARESDAAGRITWEGLLPELTYRWAILSEQPTILAMRPPVDYEVVPGSAGGVSGRVYLLPGDHEEFRVSCSIDTEVAGTIGLPPGVDAARIDVVLLGTDHHETPSQVPVVRERAVTGSAAGGQAFPFRFGNISPGRKMLRVAWQWPAGGVDTVCFAARALVVAPDEKRDAGCITPTADTSRLRLRIVPPPGVAPAESVGRVRLRVISKSVESVGKFDLGSDVVTEVLVPIGREFRLVGLPIGMVRLMAEFGTPDSTPPDQPAGWPESRMWVLHTPREDIVDLPVATDRASITFDIRRLPLGEGTSWSVLLLSEDGQTAIGRRLDPRRPESTRITVPSGTYDLLVLPSLERSGHRARDARGSCFRARGVRIRGDVAIDAWPLEKAYRVEGFVDGLGERASQQYVGFRMQGWPAGFVPFKAPIGADGSFVIPCVPGNTVLTEVVTGSGSKITVRQADVRDARIGGR